MAHKLEIVCDYQDYIPGPPVPTETLWARSTSSDGVTIKSWRDIWITNIHENHRRFGPFKDRGVGQLFGMNEYKPAIIAGSGPSLKRNAHVLKNRGKLMLISCLHNFHFMEDNDLAPEYYVTLDAGDITIGEVTEGGTRTEEEYWALTKDRTLVAFIATSPRLLEKWQGEILFYNAPIPDKAYEDAVAAVEPFWTFIGNGGNVLGACLYLAKGIFGSSVVIFTGADFSFGYDQRFHAWNSKYDANKGHCMRMTDVFGNRVLTWQSYANFKSWFDYIAVQVPGLYINASEGGCFGSYPEGNIIQVKQMDLAEALAMFNMHEKIRAGAENPEINPRTILF